MTRNLIFFLIFFLPTTAALSQDGSRNNARDPQAREKIKAAHAAYITQRLELTSEEAERFWPVYREYNDKRRAVRQEMRSSRKSQPNDEAILKHDLELKQREVDLEKEYTGKLAKIISSEKMVKLRDAEADFRRLLLRQLHERRPQRR